MPDVLHAWHLPFEHDRPEQQLAFAGAALVAAPTTAHVCPCEMQVGLFWQTLFVQLKPEQQSLSVLHFPCSFMQVPPHMPFVHDKPSQHAVALTRTPAILVVVPTSQAWPRWTHACSTQ